MKKGMERATQQSRATIDFNSLVQSIQLVNTQFADQASRAVNISLTHRNWCIGCYIHEYELHGSDRARYGEKLIDRLARSLQDVPRTQKRELNRYRLFYKSYPRIGETLSPQLQGLYHRQLEAENKKRETASPRCIEPGELIAKLSFSHFDLLITIDDPTKRAFYEIEAILGNWSVRELKRQINSLYYERSGLSHDKKKLSELAGQGAEKQSLQLTLRDPYVFEFLGLKSKEVMSESQLEDELLDKLEEFLLELGHGFCFEARQKRILIGGTHNFVDLVFYHRILKCHVLVELKLAEFNHENIGQLNTYLSWYRENIMTQGDNPPIGILLCTDKDHALVKYALAGMDDNLFVSKYLLELPKKEEMERFIEEKLRESGR